MSITKEQIVKAYDNYRDAVLAEFELSQQEDAVKVAKIKAHEVTLIAKGALEDLKA